MDTQIRSGAAQALIALVLTLAIAGCSKSPSEKTGPLVTAPAHSDAATVHASLESKAMQSKYTAHLENGRIVSIDEVRTTPQGGSAQGTYFYYEARLVKYRGEGITTSGHEEVEFDLHGAIKQSRAEVGTPGAEEIAAIRNRAELVRSHALTQQTVQTHHTS